jgi:uncharacterized membrane protein
MMTEQFTKSIIVKGDVSTLYGLWANFENFPHFMTNLKSVTQTGEGTTHWKMVGPMKTTLEWDAETTRMEEGKRIAWRSRENSPFKTSGQVTFTALPQNDTEITVTLQMVPPHGALGGLVARLFADPEGQLTRDLRQFKAYAEHQRSENHEMGRS